MEAVLTIISKAETEITRSLTRAARLRQSILKRAFEGKLCDGATDQGGTGCARVYRRGGSGPHPTGRAIAGRSPGARRRPHAAVARRAGRAGLRPGDVVTALDGKPVNDTRELIERISAIKPGGQGELTVRAQEASRKCASRPASVRRSVPSGSSAETAIPLGSILSCGPIGTRARRQKWQHSSAVVLRRRRIPPQDDGLLQVMVVA